MSISCYLLDDEPLAVAELHSMLRQDKRLDVLGQETNPKNALSDIEELDIDLLFLDINMPELNGFQFLEKLSSVPEVIFITAYDEYAIKAFEVNALDYLLKPLNPQRLRESVEKAIGKIESTNEASEKLGIEQRIFIKDGEQCHFVPIPEIEWLESVGNYVQVYYFKGRPLLHRSLNYMEERLPSELFFRANRQQMFNLNFVSNILPHFNSSLQVLLKNGQKLEMSQRQSSRFKQMMGI